MFQRSKALLVLAVLAASTCKKIAPVASVKEASSGPSSAASAGCQEGVAYGLRAVLEVKPRLLAKEAEAAEYQRIIEEMNTDLGPNFSGSIPVPCMRSFYAGFLQGIQKWRSVLTLQYAMEMVFYDNATANYGGRKAPLPTGRDARQQRSREFLANAKGIQDMYRPLFAGAGVDPEDLFGGWAKDAEQFPLCDVCRFVTKQMYSYAEDAMISAFLEARETGSAVSFGRFLFTSNFDWWEKDKQKAGAEDLKKIYGAYLPLTRFEYRRGANGELLREADGTPQMDPGTYEKEITTLVKDTGDMITAFSREPFSRNDFLTRKGTERYEQKMQTYDQWRVRLQQRRRSINLGDMAPNLDKDLQKVGWDMVKAEENFLTESIKQFDKYERNIVIYAAVAAVAVVLAPVLLPTSPVLGSVAALVGGSKMFAAGVISLSTLGVFAAVASTVQMRQMDAAAKEHGFVVEPSQRQGIVIDAVISGFPLAAEAPLFVPTILETPFKIPQIFTTARGWWAGGAAFIRNVPTIGAGASVAEVGGMIRAHFGAYKFWGVGAEAAKQSRVIWANFFANQAVFWGTQVTYTVLSDDPKQKLWYRDADGKVRINGAIAVSMASGTLGGIISGPLVQLKTFGDRYMSGLAVTILTTTLASTAASAVLEGEEPLDAKKLSAYLAWYNIGTFLFAEPGRDLKLSPAVTNRSFALQFFLNTMLNIGISQQSTPMANWFLTTYLKGRDTNVDEKGEFIAGKAPTAEELATLKRVYLDEYFSGILDLSEFTDEALLKAVAQADLAKAQGKLIDVSELVVMPEDAQRAGMTPVDEPEGTDAR